MIFVVYKADAGCKFRVCYFFADSVRFSDQGDGGSRDNADPKPGVRPVQRRPCVLVFAEDLTGELLLGKRREDHILPAAVQDERLVCKRGQRDLVRRR